MSARLRQSTGPAGTTLLGFGSCRGNRVVTNDDISKLVDTNDEWIRQRVGIVERRLADPDQSLVDMAVEAGSETGLFPADERVSEYLDGRTDRPWQAERSDPDAELAQRVSIALPPGRFLRNAPKAVSIATPFGAYTFRAREESGKLVMEESLSMPQQRVPPERYAGFAAFARAVDEAQSQELLVAP